MGNHNSNKRRKEFTPAPKQTSGLPYIYIRNFEVQSPPGSGVFNFAIDYVGVQEYQDGENEIFNNADLIREGIPHHVTRSLSLEDNTQMSEQFTYEDSNGNDVTITNQDLINAMIARGLAYHTEEQA